MDNKIVVVPEGVQLTSNSLVIDNGMVIDEWLQLMDTLGCIEDANAWWIGAGLNQGEKIYGELYAQALDESKAKSWRNYKWVENKIKVSSRLDIPWSHHQEAARLEDANPAN